MSSPGRLVVRILALAAVLVPVACSSEPLEFADWTIPVPEGTPIREYAPVQLEERNPDAVRLVEDLVIGGDLSDPNAALYRPTSVVASEEGNIFVADGASQRIQMFGPDGEHLRTLGAEGQGPGEFENIWAMTIAGDLLVVDDRNNHRLSIWTLDGEHVTEHTKDARGTLFSIQGLTDGSFVSRYTGTTQNRDRVVAVTLRSIDDTEIARPIEFPRTPPIIPENSWSARDMVEALIELWADPRILLTVGSGELIYVSPVHEYQVLAMSENGNALWALRVAWPRPPFPTSVKQAMLERAQRGQETISIDAIEWPEEYSAVASLRTDGAGRLYVFPEIPSDGDEPPTTRPVDVYSSTGELLVAGFVPDAWTYAAGDYVYGLREDESGDLLVVRYRLSLSGAQSP